jgi:hypothetical protein
MNLKFTNLEDYTQKVILLSTEEPSTIADLYLILTWAFVIFKRKLGYN